MIEMTKNKRFLIDDAGELIDLNNHKFIDYGDECCKLLNELNDEKEAWKQSCCSYSNFNSVLLYELDIARERGFEVSNPFKQFLENRRDME